MEDNIYMKGWFHLLARHSDGTVFEERHISNTVHNVGKQAIVGLMVADVSGTSFDWMAVGTGTPVTGTGLGAECLTGGGERRGGANVAGTRITTTTTGDTGQWVTTWTFTSSFTLTEAALFNANTGAALGATILASQSFSAVNVINTDTITLTWKLQLT